MSEQSDDLGALKRAHEDLKRAKEDLDLRRFECMVEAFMRRWAPPPAYRSEFEAEFFGIVRQIYADAQAPLLDRFARIASFSPIIIDPKADGQNT